MYTGGGVALIPILHRIEIMACPDILAYVKSNSKFRPNSLSKGVLKNLY